jgi:hypothetical protein
MKISEIEVGAIYRLGGQYKVPKRVVALDAKDTSVNGGRIRIQNITHGAAIETWSAEYFAEHAVEKLSVSSGQGKL